MRSAFGLGTAQRNFSGALVVTSQNYSGTHALSFLFVCAILLFLILLPTAKSMWGALPAATTNPVQNIMWHWMSAMNQSSGAKTAVLSPENYAISFCPDGTLSGKVDCNIFNGTYSQQYGFTIKLGASAQMYCGDTSLDQQYLKLLGNVAAGGPDGAGTLTMETAGGEQRMFFKNGGATSNP